MSDGRKRQRETEGGDGQSETETWLKRGKIEKLPYVRYYFAFFATVTQFYLTTGTTESIIWLLQQLLILTTPGKKFREI